MLAESSLRQWPEQGELTPIPQRSGRGRLGLASKGVVAVVIAVLLVRRAFGWIDAPLAVVEKGAIDSSTETIPLLVEHPQCSNSYASDDGRLRLEVSETSTEVRIRTQVERQWFSTGCADSLEPVAASAELGEPLGQRTLVLVQP